ncbi:ankyrin repeat domain-containing protein [Chlamydiales bacterium]|nr:ankyrin repeat domain-containing protein [Chlamydiales bacterium]
MALQSGQFVRINEPKSSLEAPSIENKFSLLFNSIINIANTALSQHSTEEPLFISIENILAQEKFLSELTFTIDSLVKKHFDLIKFPLNTLISYEQFSSIPLSAVEMIQQFSEEVENSKEILFSHLDRIRGIDPEVTLDHLILQIDGSRNGHRDALILKAERYFKDDLEKYWVLNKGRLVIPKEINIDRIRLHFLKYYDIDHRPIQEASLKILIKMLENDPITESSAQKLILLIHELMTLHPIQKEKGKREEFNSILPSKQKLIIKAIAIGLDCILLQTLKGNLNAQDEEFKNRLIEISKYIDRINIQKDPVYHHWALHAKFAATHIQTDSSFEEKFITGLLFTAASLLKIVEIILVPEMAFRLDLSGISKNIIHFFKGFVWDSKKWFLSAHSIRQIARASMHNIDCFKQLIPHFIESKKGIAGDNKHLLFSYVHSFEQAVIFSLDQEVKREAIKLLIQYLFIDNSLVKERVLLAFQEIVINGDEKSSNTAYIILKSLETSQVINGKDQNKTLRELSEFLEKFREKEKKIQTRENCFSYIITYFLKRALQIDEKKDATGITHIILLAYTTVDIEGFVRAFETIPFFHNNLIDDKGSTIYHHLAAEGKSKGFKFIKKSRFEIDINLTNFRGDAAIHLATIKGYSNTLREILDSGANVNQTNRQGETALHLTAKTDDLEIREALCYHSKNLDPDIKDVFGKTALNRAIEYGHLPTFNAIRAKDGKIAQETADYTPIIVAARLAKPQIVKHLVNGRDEPPNELEAVEILQMIDKAPSDLPLFLKFHQKRLSRTGKYRQSFSQFSNPSEIGHTIASATLPDALGNTKLMLYAKEGKADQGAKHLSKHKKSINKKNTLQETAALLATSFRQHHFLSMLKENHADFNLGNIHGFTPAHIAAYHQDLQAITIIHEGGGNFSIKNTNGETPLHILSGKDPDYSPFTLSNPQQQDHSPLEILQFIANLSDPTITDINGNNALHRAALWGTPEIIAFLIEKFPALFWEKNLQGFMPIELIHDLEKIQAFSSSSITNEIGIREKTYWEEHQKTKRLANLLARCSAYEALKILFLENPKTLDFVNPIDGYTPLHEAALQGCTEILTYYSENKKALLITDKEGNTPLHLAASAGHLAFIKEHDSLIPNHCPKENFEGRLPVHLAAMNGHLEVVKYLSENKSCILIRDSHLNLPIHLACSNGHQDTFYFLYNTHRKSLEFVNDQGHNCLHLATLHGANPIVFYILGNQLEKISKGNQWVDHREITTPIPLNINAQDNSGKTALHLAATQGYRPLVRALLLAGSYPLATDESNRTALHMSAYLSRELAVKDLLKFSKERTDTGDVSLINSIDQRGELAIHQVCKRIHENDSDKVKESQSKIITHLLLANSLIDHKNEKGETPLHLAVRSGYVHIVEKMHVMSKERTRRIVGQIIYTKPTKYLKLELKDRKGNTPLHEAVLYNQLEIAEFLLGKKSYYLDIKRKRIFGSLVNPDRTNAEDKTPLHLSIERGNLDMIELILEYKNNPRESCSHKRNLFHLLFDRDEMKPVHIEIYDLLIQKFPHLIFQQDDEGNTPLHTLSKHRHAEMIKRILGEISNPEKIKCIKNNDHILAQEIHQDLTMQLAFSSKNSGNSDKKTSWIQNKLQSLHLTQPLVRNDSVSGSETTPQPEIISLR